MADENPAVKGVDDRAKAQEEANAEAQRRSDEAKPTPTQRENDLAKVGVVVEEKEDDGSAPEQKQVSPDGAVPYQTRDAAAEGERRPVGRPRKAD